MGDVLEKLGRRFHVYLELLRLVRRDYLHFVTRFRDQAFEHFMEEMTHYERETSRGMKMDHFLDLYSQWLKTKDREVERQLRQVTEEMQQFDPNFGRDIFKDSGGLR